MNLKHIILTLLIMLCPHRHGSADHHYAQQAETGCDEA